jgi:cytochrome b subunit of formate dehydrogenase
MHGDRLVETCRTCHPTANARFAMFDPHADYRDGDRYPVLNAIWWYFIVVISAALGFFGLHSVLWFGRRLIERIRHGPPARVEPPATAIRRFTKLNRLNHALVIVTFLGLVLTGIPLLFSDAPWAAALARMLGGIVQAGTWHRCLAVLLILNFAIHFYGLARAARAYPGPWLRGWLLGPNSMLPRLKDLRDCAGMFRWFLRGGRQPSFDRWTYWEKFDYWAEIFGSLIIGGSGLMLWFPELFARFLPGWIFNVAMVVHGYEALLALGFIFTIHFFNAHLRLEKFPVDDVIFTGSLSEEEMKHERPEEYRRLVETGRLEALRVPAPPRWLHKVAVVIGILAMAVGITLVTLIVLAGVGVLRDGL